MKRFLLIAVNVLLVTIHSNGQIDTSLFRKVESVQSNLSTFSNEQEVELQELREGGGILTRNTYKEFLDKTFTYLSYNRGTLPTGNSASLDLLENETQIKFSLAKKIGSQTDYKRILIATAGLQATLDDGIADVFNGRTATTGTSFFLNSAFLPGAAKFKYVISQRDANNNRVSVPKNTLDDKMLRYKRNFEQQYINLFSAKYSALIARWLEIDGHIKSGPCKCAERNPVDCPCDKISQTKRLNDLMTEKAAIEKTLTDDEIISADADEITDAIMEKYKEGLMKLETKVAAWEWYKLFWISGGINYTRESYDTYNSTIPVLSDRFDTKEFDLWSAKVTFNWFKEKSQAGGLIRSSYFNISYEPKRINTFSDISGKDVEKTVTSANVGDTLIVYKTNKKVKDISGVEYKTGWRHVIGSAYTAMLGKKQNLGINLLLQTEVGNFTAPTYNSRIGFLLRFVNNNHDPEDDKSEAKINLEFFIKFPDMSDTGGDGNSVWQKRIIGVSTNIPFSKVFFK